MITRVELENFKAVRERAVVDLRPITLLFGANSAGKSTLIQALHYALEVLVQGNPNPDRTGLGGQGMDLGGFQSFVHAHDLERTLVLKLEVDARTDTLADHTRGVREASSMDDATGEYADLDERVLSAWVRLRVGWNRAASAPRVLTYEVGWNGSEEACVVIATPPTTELMMTGTLSVLTDDPLLDNPGDDLDEGRRVARLLDAAGAEFAGAVAVLPLYDQASAVPVWGRALTLWPADDSAPSRELRDARRLVSKLAVGSGELVVRELKRLLYVGPLRVVPPRAFQPLLSMDAARWADGLGAWDALYRGGVHFVSRVSAWMARLETGYRLELTRVSACDATAAETLLGMVDEILASGSAGYAPSETSRKAKGVSGRARRPSPSVRPISAFRAPLWREMQRALASARQRDELVLVDERNGVALQPYDVGVGISQVLPVIVAALYRGGRGAGGGLVAIEQPELHIHPKLQVSLADLFIEQSCAGTLSDHWFLLETHSEHILLRLLRRVREAHEAAPSDGDASNGRLPALRTGGLAAQAKSGRAPRQTPGQRQPEPTRGGPQTSARGRLEPDGQRRNTPGARTGANAPIVRRRANAPLLGGPDDPDVEDSATRPAFSPERVSVVYVQRGDDGSTQFVPLRIDEAGEFADVWPEGFFDERLRELY